MIRRIGDIVGGVQKKLLRETTKKVLGIGADWAKIAGEQVARHSVVQGMKQKILYVQVRSPALLNELANFKKDELLNKLRAQYPDQHIRDIKFVI